MYTHVHVTISRGAGLYLHSLGPLAFSSVNHIETCTSWYNLYLHMYMYICRSATLMILCKQRVVERVCKGSGAHVVDEKDLNEIPDEIIDRNLASIQQYFSKGAWATLERRGKSSTDVLVKANTWMKHTLTSFTDRNRLALWKLFHHHNKEKHDCLWCMWDLVSLVLCRCGQRTFRRKLVVWELLSIYKETLLSLEIHTCNNFLYQHLVIICLLTI